MLTRRGVTAWRHALAGIAPATCPPAPAAAPAPVLPGPLAAELVSALAAVALAAT
ncbi:MAG: hypothetical protein ACRDND_07780 [Streptosporangiaceae bacterium]